MSNRQVLEVVCNHVRELLGKPLHTPIAECVTDLVVPKSWEEVVSLARKAKPAEPLLTITNRGRSDVDGLTIALARRDAEAFAVTIPVVYAKTNPCLSCSSYKIQVESGSPKGINILASMLIAPLPTGKYEEGIELWSRKFGKEPELQYFDWVLSKPPPQPVWVKFDASMDIM